MSGASNTTSQQRGLRICIVSLTWVYVGSPWLCRTLRWAKVSCVKCQVGQGHHSGLGSTPQPRLSQRKNHWPVRREAESYVRGGGGGHGAGHTGSPSEAGGLSWGQTGRGQRGPPAPMSTDGSLTPLCQVSVFYRTSPKHKVKIIKVTGSNDGGHPGWDRPGWQALSWSSDRNVPRRQRLSWPWL